MDPITHAASGVLAALAMKEQYRPTSRMFFPFAALVAAFPDVDIFFGNTATDYLLLHRGITHSLAAVPILAFFLTLLAVPLWLRRSTVLPEKEFEPYVENTAHAPKTDARQNRRWLNIIWPAWIRTKTHPLGRRFWSFRKVYLFSICLLLLHIWLDVVTTYGTMIFLPFSEYRVRLNGLFIVDIFLALPMLLAIWHGGGVRRYAIMGLIWVFLYPATCVGIRFWHEGNMREQLVQSSVVEKVGAVQNISVLPDLFAPFYWRVIYQTDKPYKENISTEFTWSQAKSRLGYHFPPSTQSVYHQGLNFLGKAYTPLMQYPALRQDVAKMLATKSRRARAFESFLLMPIQEQLAVSKDGWQEYGVYDLRFSTMFVNLYEFLWEMNDGQPTFLMAVRGLRASINDAALAASVGAGSTQITEAVALAAKIVGGVGTDEGEGSVSSLPLDSAILKAPVDGAAVNWSEVRLVFSGAGRDSGWQKMEKPREVLWWQELIGIPY